MGYGSDVFVGGTPTARTNSSNAHLAFDDDGAAYLSGHAWEGPPSGDVMWLQYALASAKTIQKLTIQASDGEADECPTTFKFQASNTGAWGGEEATLLDVVADPAWSALEKREWTFANSNAYSYYRVYWNSSAWWCIGEMEGMEASASPPAESGGSDGGLFFGLG